MENDIQKELEDRIAALPPVVQDAIASADVEAQLRELSKTHKLHLDQWGLLENEVMITLLGIERPENLAANIEKQVGVDRESAVALAADVSRIVFEPIRSELEHALNTSARDTDISIPTPATDAPLYIIPAEPISAQTTPRPAPLSPLPNPPTTQTTRADIHPNYIDSASHERKSIVGDPYREQA